MTATVKPFTLLEASHFTKGTPEIKDALRRSRVLPVNDVYLPTWDVQTRIMLFYGSYGSGKSVYVVDRLIEKCRTAKYFRCFYGRKVLDKVRESVFQTIVDEIEAQHLQHEFNYSKQPNGSMTITHRITGHQFIPFGGSDPDSMKSVKDPTDIVMEELDQWAFTDFSLLLTRLRTEKAVTQLWGMFNTDRVYQAHWIRAKILEPKHGSDYTDMLFALKTTFRDNYFVNREDYDRTLRISAGGDMAKYNAIAKAEWGSVRTGAEAWKKFSEERHIKQVKINTSRTIHLSIDENVVPYVTVSVWQPDTEARMLRQVYEIPCESPDNNAPKAAKKVCDWLDRIDYKDVVYIYGDPSASHRSTIDPNNASFFDVFIDGLRQRGYTVISRVQRSAPEVALSIAFINELYETGINGWGVEIDEDCFVSIEDYLTVKEDADGKLLKEKVKDKETGVTYEKVGHFSDAKRYFITTVLAAEFAHYKAKRGRRQRVIEVPG